MAEESRYSLPAMCIEDDSRWVSSKTMECIDTGQVKFMKAFSKMAKATDSERRLLKTVTSTKVTGKMVRVMAMELLQKRQDQFTLEIGIWAKSMAKVSSISRKDIPMLVNLRMEDFTVLESTLNKMNDMKENGNMISDMGMG